MSTTNFDDLDPESPEFEAAVEAAQAAEDAEREGTQTAAAEGEGDIAQRQAEEAANNAAASAALAATTTTTEPEKPSKPEGVLSKDGKTVLPWAVVHAARSEKAAERQARLAAEAERDALKQQIEDLKAGKRPVNEDEDELDAAVAAAAEDVPVVAELHKRLKAAEAALKQGSKPAQEDTTTDEPSSDPLQDDIDSVPLLAGWQATGGPEFEAAKALDTALLRSPKWKDKPRTERFAEVARQVADQFDIQVEDEAPPNPTPTPNRADPKAVIAKAGRTAPNTLSDFKGGAAATPPDRIDKMGPAQALRRMEDMTDEEIEEHLAKFG